MSSDFFLMMELMIGFIVFNFTYFAEIQSLYRIDL